MVDANHLRDALEKPAMEPDQAAALAPDLARHLAAAGADVRTGQRAGSAAWVRHVQPGREPELPYGSVPSLFRQMPFAIVPWILAGGMGVICPSSPLARLARYR